jgi:1-acyl-sn-glycerol-3-phosphate acyltransferase
MSSIETLPAPRLTVSATRFVRAGRRCWRLAWIVLHLLAGVAAAQILLLGPNAPLPRAQVQRMQGAVVRWWVRGLSRILHLDVRVRGPLPTRTSLLVTNHVSWLDIPALLTAFDAAFVAKQDVVRWPLIGGLAVRAGTIFLARGQRNAAKHTADGMTWRLAQRRHVILFPEATTSDGRGVRRFYARLYQAAVRTHSRIQAVAIRYPNLDGPQGAAPFIDDDELVSHLWRLLGEKRIVAELHFCDPILPDADRRTLADRTRHQICAALGIEPQLSQPLSAKLRFPRQRAA